MVRKSVFLHESFLHESFLHESFLHESFLHESFLHESFLRKRNDKKMKKITTINTLLVFLVIIGTIFANLSTVVSIMPKSTTERDVEIVDNSTTIATNEFDVKTLTEIADYMSDQAAQNDFEISTMVYSSGLLFESDNSLIVIGHGYFSSNNQYFISDYSTNRISKMAKNKEMVALLACYSSNVELENNLQLTYTDTIDLTTAIQDLFSLLRWTESTQFNPIKNIQLFNLDPGGSGNGWSLSNPPPAFNMMRQAHTYDGTHKYWNLLTDSGVKSLSAYMMSNKYRKIEFTFRGEFLEQTAPNQQSYYINTHSVTFDSWILIEGDLKDYLHIENIYLEGVLQKRQQHNLQVDDIVGILVSEEGIASRVAALTVLGGALIPLAVILLTTGIKLLKIALVAGAAGTSTALGLSATASCVLGCLAVTLGIIIVAIAVAILIAAVVIAFTW